MARTLGVGRLAAALCSAGRIDGQAQYPDAEDQAVAVPARRRGLPIRMASSPKSGGARDRTATLLQCLSGSGRFGYKLGFTDRGFPRDAKSG
jgi:hypothetical protein